MPVSSQPQKMGPSEALVETLAANGVTHVFGIVGSAFMDALDIFPAAGIELRARRARARRDSHGRRLRARIGTPWGLHRAERPGRHELRHRRRGGLLGAFAGGVHHPGNRLDVPGARRIPGDRTAADLLEDHQVSRTRQQPEAHGGDRGALLRPRHARDGPGAAEHSARFLLRRDRGDDLRRPCALRHGPGDSGGARCGGRHPRGRAVSGHPRGRRRDHVRRHGRGDRDLRNCSAHPSATATCTTIPSRPRILSRSVRSAIRARRPR